MVINYFGFTNKANKCLQVSFFCRSKKATVEVAFRNYNYEIYFTSCISFLINGETTINKTPAINA